MTLMADLYKIIRWAKFQRNPSNIHKITALCMPPGALRINDMDFILNGPHVKYNSSSLRKTEKSKFKENTEFQIKKTKKICKFTATVGFIWLCTQHHFVHQLRGWSALQVLASYLLKLSVRFEIIFYWNKQGLTHHTKKKPSENKISTCISHSMIDTAFPGFVSRTSNS